MNLVSYYYGRVRNKNMAEDIPEVWESTFQGKRSFGARGPRDVLIIVSSESLEGPDIVPRKKGELTQEDKDMLASEDIPSESWVDDVKLIQERYHRGKKELTLTDVCSNPKSVNFALDKIAGLLNNTGKPGVVIHYIGPGRRHTGDWCFQDGFITFNEIMILYNQYFTGKVLALVCDCSYSEKWMELFIKYQDEHNIQPCGHSAKAAKKLLFIATSCQSEEIPHILYFSARGCHNDKNTGEFYVMQNKIAEDQHSYLCDNTRLTCGANNIDMPCLIPDNYCSWKNVRIANRLCLARKPDFTWWGFFLVIDDKGVIDQIINGQADPSDYGELIRSGIGRDPPENVKEWIDKEYPGHGCY